MSGERVDYARVERLTGQLLRAVKLELTRPLGRDNVLVSLNALASAVAFVIAGTDGDRRAWTFFERALADQIVALRNAERSCESAVTRTPPAK